MIAPGKMACPDCSAGYKWPPPSGYAWKRCDTCDGVGAVWRPGGPTFGATLGELGERVPGEIVELGTGHRGRVLWHMPRKTKRTRPEITFLGLIDDFDDHEDDKPTAFHSVIGVVSVQAKQRATLGGAAAEIHDGEKDADLVDPFARRQREAVGDLL